MKIKKTLLSVAVLSIIVLSSMSSVNALEDDPGPVRSMEYADSIETTIVE